MDNDDAQVGRLLSRREALRLMAAASAVMLAGCGSTGSGTTQATSTAAEAGSNSEATVVATLEAAGPNEEAATALVTAVNEPNLTATLEATAGTTAVAGATLPTCIVSPALTEGPYIVDEQLQRSDIRANSSDNTVAEGTLLELAVRVSQIDTTSGCTPLGGAIVDIWHCDALGVYSGVTDSSEGFDTTQQNFLRGYQVTDASGLAQFTTIYPGWYSGRAVHIHFKVRANAPEGQAYEFTSQFFFDDALSEQVYKQEPYASKGQPDTPNATDGIYRGGGDQLLLAFSPADEGYTTTFDIGLDLANPPAEQQGGPGAPRP